ncbi:MAG: DUF4258 domain-containing protein [Promethearchaeota archaeon]
MSIIYTKHSLLQMKNRKISPTQIESILKNPQKKTDDEFGNQVAQKIIDNYLIRVIYKIQDENIVIITAYRTSKLNKYI